MPAEKTSARRLVEQAEQAHAGLVVDGQHHIGVFHVVDPGDVLVADALDAMPAKAVQDKGGTLECLAGSDLAGGEELLHIIAAADGAG